MPALDALYDDFLKANTQPLGVSVDSRFCHGNWAKSLGGIAFPLLADFHPKGALAKSLNLFLEDAGITDRATVWIDADGVIQDVVAVGPGGKRDMGELLARCQKMDQDYAGSLAAFASGAPTEATLFVKSECGHSANVLMALDNLHLRDNVKVLNVSRDDAAKTALMDKTGKDQAPALVAGDQILQESGDIIKKLVTDATGLWAG